MLIYNLQINPQTCTQTPTDYSLCLRVFQRQELHADLWVSDGAAVTASGYSGPQTLTPHQAGSRPAGDPNLQLSPPVLTLSHSVPAAVLGGSVTMTLESLHRSHVQKLPRRHIMLLWQFVLYARKI